MNSQESIVALEALLTTFTDEVKGAQGKVDALTVALTLLKEGYTTDQTRIDTEIQSGKDAVAAQVASLLESKSNITIALEKEQSAKDAAVAQVTDLQSQLDLEQAASLVKDQTIADLQAASQPVEKTPVDLAPTETPVEVIQ